MLYIYCKMEETQFFHNWKHINDKHIFTAVFLYKAKLNILTYLQSIVNTAFNK